MGRDRGASLVEYLLVVVAVAIVLFGAVSYFSRGFGQGAQGALNGVEATTTTAAVLGQTLVRGGGGDVALWVPPGAEPDPLLLAARPGIGLAVLDAGRRLLDFAPLPGVAGVDVRPDGGGAVAVVGDGSSFRVYRLDARSSRLEPVGDRLPAGVEVAGLCLSRNPATGELHVFPFSRDGAIVEWRLDVDGGRGVDARRVRSLRAGGAAACVADDSAGALFVSDPDAGLWRFPLGSGVTERVPVDRVGPGGGLVAGVDALAVLDDPAGGPGWLLASSESDETFSFYRRDGANEPTGRFAAAARVDRCHDTSGLAVAGAHLLCQGPDETTLVPLEDVTRLLSP